MFTPGSVRLWAPLRFTCGFRERAVASGVRLERAIFSGLLMLIALAAVPFGAVEPWWEAIFEGAIFMLGACWISTSMIGKRWRMPAVLAPIGALIVFAYLQTLPLWSANFSSDLMQGASQARSVDPFETKRFLIKLLAVALTLAMLL